MNLFKWPKRVSSRARRALEAVLGERRVVRGDLVLRSLHAVSLQRIFDALEELNVLAYMRSPRTEEDIENYADIRERQLFLDCLTLLVQEGLVREAGGKFLFTGARPRIPKFVEEMRENPSVAPALDVVSVLGTKLVDVLVSGRRVFDWEKDAAVAWEALEISVPFVLARARMLDEAYAYMIRRRKRRVRLCIVGTACGWALLLAHEYFKRGRLSVELYGVEFSERTRKLACDLTEERNVPCHVVYAEPTVKFRTLLRETFDLVLVAHQWYFIAPDVMPRLLQSLASILTLDGAIVDFHFVRQRTTLAFDAVFKTIRQWVGVPDVYERRDIYRTLFERVKERAGSKLLRAEYPMR